MDVAGNTNLRLSREGIRCDVVKRYASYAENRYFYCNFVMQLVGFVGNDG